MAFDKLKEIKTRCGHRSNFDNAACSLNSKTRESKIPTTVLTEFITNVLNLNLPKTQNPTSYIAQGI